MTVEEQNEMIALRHAVASAWIYLDLTEMLLARHSIDESELWTETRNHLDEAIGLLALFAGAVHHITQERTHRRVLRDLAKALHAHAATQAS